MTSANVLAHHGVTPTLGPGVWLAPSAFVIGDVEIGAGSGIWFGCTVRGDVNHVRIGARTNIQDGTVIHVAGDHNQAAYNAGGRPTLIGDGVTVGHMALIHACTLEDGSFVGMQACVMDGAVVERGAMVAAGALVTPGKRVPSGEVWAGRPAKFLRAMTDAEIADIPASADRYARLAASYLGG